MGLTRRHIFVIHRFVPRMRKLLVVVLLLIVAPSVLTEVRAQEPRHHFLIGFNPVLTVSTEHRVGEFDLNIAPMAYIYRISEKFDFRVSSILNVGYRRDHDYVTYFGLEFALPWYPVYQESEDLGSFLVYTAPVLHITRNQGSGYSHLGLWVEPGFQVAPWGGTAFSVGAQVGAAYHLPDDASPQLEPHLGLRLTWGAWW